MPHMVFDLGLEKVVCSIKAKVESNKLKIYKLNVSLPCMFF